MGIDVHGLQFLRFARRFGPFGDSVMIGRQGVHVSAAELQASLGTGAGTYHGQYAERLLADHFGATSVDSVDVSDYEAASILHDFNLPVPETLYGRYDTLIDFGTLEHIFQIPQALKNCSLLLRPGGQVLHVLPANNLCGHGFWQFSPELFLSLYSAQNGYAAQKCFLADLGDLRHWFEIESAPPGERITARSARPLYILVRAVRSGSHFAHDAVQQSDYLVTWATSEDERRLKARLTPWARWLRSLHKRLGRLDGTRYMTKRSIDDLVRPVSQG